MCTFRISPMFTPSFSRLRKNLRQAVIDEFPNQDAGVMFDSIRQDGIQFIQVADLERFCEKAECPASALPNIFAPYGVRQMLIGRPQWSHFINDGLCSDCEADKSLKERSQLTERQHFLMNKFVHSMKVKFGNTVYKCWNAALARNPPNTLNTTLRLSALCHLFETMNLPFSVSEFVDSTFTFYGGKIEGITFGQFELLFDSFM